MRSCPANPLLIGHPEAARVINTVQLDVAVALLGAVVAVLYRRWRDSSPASSGGPSRPCSRWGASRS